MKAIELTTKNKVGYLNPKTGKYKYVAIVGIDTLHPKTGTPAIQLTEKLRTGWQSYSDNTYYEQIENLDKYANTGSADWKDERVLIKFR